MFYKFCLIVFLVAVFASCKSTDKKDHAYTNEDSTAQLESGVITKITLQDPDIGKSYEQNFQSDIKSYASTSHELRDFNLTTQSYFENNPLKLVNLTSHAEILFTDDNNVPNGCYNAFFVATSNNYYIDNHVFISQLNEKFPDLSNLGYTFFVGEICLKEKIIFSIKKKSQGNQKYNFEDLFNYFESIGLKKFNLEGQKKEQLRLTFKKIDFNINGKKYTAREETLAGSQRHVIVNLPNGQNKRVFIPASENLDTWIKKGSTQRHLADLSENRHLSSSVRFSDASDSSLQYSPPLDRARSILSSYSEDFGSVSSKFTRERGTGTPAGSSNIVQFGKIEGLEGDFVLRSVKDVRKLTPKKRLDYKKEQDIIDVLAVANLTLPIGGKNGRTLIPQPLSMASDGVSSISQKLHPLSRTHMQFGSFSYATLQTQLRSMAETIQFLHTPKKVDGIYYSISHRDLKPENFLQQSSVDPRAASTDFDLSEMISADSLEELATVSSQRKNYGAVGTPKTVDPNILKKDLTFDELKQSDIWSLGITMLENSFGPRTFFNMLGNPRGMGDLIRIYRSDKAISGSVESYLRKSDSEILSENPGMTLEQLNGMRSFTKSDEYRLIKNEMLVVDPALRSDIDDIVDYLSAKTN